MGAFNFSDNKFGQIYFFKNGLLSYGGKFKPAAVLKEVLNAQSGS